MAKGPNSTPLVAGGRLFTLGVTGILTAWSVADGTIAWRQDYSASIGTSKLFCGTAMSPMLEGGSLIVQVGSDVHGGRVLALDPATGKERLCVTLPFVTDAGILIVARRTAEGFTEERRYEISHSPTWSVPVMLPGGMIVRDAAGVVKLLWE